MAAFVPDSRVVRGSRCCCADRHIGLRLKIAIRINTEAGCNFAILTTLAEISEAYTDTVDGSRGSEAPAARATSALLEPRRPFNDFSKALS